VSGTLGVTVPDTVPPSVTPRVPDTLLSLLLMAQMCQPSPPFVETAVEVCSTSSHLTKQFLPQHYFSFFFKIGQLRIALFFVEA
jgi:hypothetical protein